MSRHDELIAEASELMSQAENKPQSPREILEDALCKIASEHGVLINNLTVAYRNVSTIVDNKFVIDSISITAELRNPTK